MINNSSLENKQMQQLSPPGAVYFELIQFKLLVGSRSDKRRMFREDSVMLTSWDNKQKQINLFDPSGVKSSLKPRTGSVWLWLMLRRPTKRIAETWICQTKGDQRKFIKFNVSSNEVSKLILKSLLPRSMSNRRRTKNWTQKAFQTTCLCFSVPRSRSFRGFLCKKSFHSFVCWCAKPQQASSVRGELWQKCNICLSASTEIPKKFLPVKQSGTGNPTSKLRRNVHRRS